MPRPSVPATNPMAAADGVFLSPRVVDQRAFDELAGALRELIERAAQESAALAAAAARAESAQRLLADSAAPADARIAAATSALGSLDARFAETAALSARENEAAAAIASRITAAEARLHEQIAALEARVTALVERAERAAAAMPPDVPRSGTCGTAEERVAASAQQIEAKARVAAPVRRKLV